MKPKIQLAIYLVFMSFLISAVLYFGKFGHGACPICNHSIASEGWPTGTDVTKAYQ